jgi:Flp pilus assembly protein TadD
MATNDKQAALSDYNRAIEIDPHSPLAYTNRGFLRLLQGKTDEAQADFERAINTAGDSRRSIEEQIIRMKHFAAAQE